MASEKLFRDIPPFPNDAPIMPLSTIKLAELHAGNTKVRENLFAACKDMGFFLLDLRGDEMGETIVQEVDELFAASTEVMDLPLEVKLQYKADIPRSFNGYKPVGIARTETNEPDRFEAFNLAQDGLMGIAEMQDLPDPYKNRLALITSFLRHGQHIAQLVTESLTEKLSLPKDTFASSMRPSKASGSLIRFIKAFASVEEKDMRTAMKQHTDFGTVTLLANVLGGL